jgi:hypothetical protein
MSHWHSGINPNRRWIFYPFFVKEVEKGMMFMKRLEEKFKRTVKYWRISYKQASERERLVMGMLALMILTYAWWVIVVL